MPPRIRNIKFEKKYVGDLRRSQTITTFGSGSLADFPRMSAIVSGIDSWTNLYSANKIYERNLQLLLGKDFFYQVSSDNKSINDTFSIPVYRFPLWYYCPKCHRLDIYSKIAKSSSWNNSEYNTALKCNICDEKLVPSRFVAACINGHIEDFPYVWWCHRNSKNGTCKNPRMLLEYKGTTGGLDAIHIKCENCGAETTMAGCMNKDALRGLSCSGNMPWLKTEDGTYHDLDKCFATLRGMQRSANNIYYSVNESALTIPPWSEKIQKKLAEKNSLFEDIFDDNEEETERRLKKEYSKHPEFYGSNYEAYRKAAYARYGNVEEDLTENDLRKEEYLAFCSEDVDHEFLRTESIEIPDVISKYFSKIKLVKKLREVMVLQGFRRILPTKPESEEERKNLGMSNREFSPLSKEPLTWLPAIELFGEGIFFELNENLVSEWERNNKNRYVNMTKKHIDKWIGKGMYDGNSPRYVLLHTLSHLIIRQLTAQCGYATASIKERIYSTYEDDNDKMCGILIYTSATDTDGSLGGLVREGQADRIADTILNMLQESSWCSNDPLCIDSKSQGFKGLNYAACHACTLLPETSCESLNCLLDRASVVGTPDNADLSFFKELL